MATLTAICTLLFSMAAFAATETEQEIGPGIAKESNERAELPEGTSLGIFTTTGYCNCSKCSGGHNLTYSGTVPQANHTVSADLTVLPIGTKVKINDIVYTVEDMGSAVDGAIIDIYYSSHSEAWDHGMKKVEVFLIEHPETTEE